MNLNILNLVVGYLFLSVSCLGCVVVASHLIGLNVFDINNYFDIFVPARDGGMASAPVFMAIVAAVGAYLVKK